LEPPNFPILKGELQAITSQMGVGRRSRSKVRVRVVGLTSLGWVEALEAWGAAVEAVVVHSTDEFKDIRRLLTLMPATTPQDAHQLLPLGPWDGCMLANLATPKDSELVASLFKQWCPAIAILWVHLLISRSDTIAMLPSALPLFYHKKMITVHHNTIGGVTTASWRFIHYTRWPDTISYPSLMTGDNLPWTLQTALSDTFGVPRGATFESQMGLDPSMGIGFLSSSSKGRRIPVFLGEAVGTDLSIIPYREQHIWVRAHSVFS
jgi:hypothetical protein